MDARPARQCQVPGCNRHAAAFVVRGEVYVGPPQELFQAGVCGPHMTEVLEPETRRQVLNHLASAFPSALN